MKILSQESKKVAPSQGKPTQESKLVKMHEEATMLEQQQAKWVRKRNIKLEKENLKTASISKTEKNTWPAIVKHIS